MKKTRRLTARTPPRPLRGTPDETRTRLVKAAAEAFERDGYSGTDTNRIARLAGYAPGTFYKHFDDKVAIFCAVYADWVAREWRAIGESIEGRQTPRQRAENIVDAILDHHRAWSGLRASLHVLIRSETAVRAAYRAQRRQQLDILESMKRRTRKPTRTREADALLLYTVERTADAIAANEPKALDLDPSRLRDLLVDLVEAHVS